MSSSADLRENRELAAELKFLISRPVAEQIRAWARDCLLPDPHASAEGGDAYRIASLYFDTERFDVFHRRKSFGRAKFRIRRYGDSAVAFLERKLKTNGLVSKRRSPVKLDELGLLWDGQPRQGWGGSWYHQRLLNRRLKPVCQIAYDRTARVSMTGLGPIRLTLDEDIRAHLTSGLIFNGTGDGMLLSPDQLILELKYRREMPLLFKQLTAEFGLTAQPVSKYQLAVAALGLDPNPASLNSSNGHVNGPASLNS